MRQIPKIEGSKKRYAVQLHVEGEQSSCSVVFAQYKANSLTVLEQGSFDSIDELIQTLDKKYPVLLTVTGDSVITKKTVNKTNYLQEVLFTSNPEDFFIYSRPIEEHRLVAIARKPNINGILKTFSDNGIAVIDLLLGAWSLCDLANLTQAVEAIQTPKYTFDPATNDLTRLSNDANALQDIRVADQTIEAKTLLAFSGLVHHFTMGQQFTNYQDLVTSLTERFTYKRLTKKVAIAAVAFLFLSLSLSYGLSAIYAQKNANIQTQLSLNNKLQSQITGLQTDIANKESIVQLAGLQNGTYLSRYVWEIAALVPEQISLTQAEVFPLERKIKEGEAIVFTQNELLISGQSDGALVASDWVRQLKELDWIKTVEFTAFTLVGNQYEFTLKIEI